MAHVPAVDDMQHHIAILAEIDVSSFRCKGDDQDVEVLVKAGIGGHGGVAARGTV